ncbi:hypothetical protein GIB67_037011 [Kingdonia uniflora]|uniref:Ubiquitin-fold modifier-conjugating enzyme 1 n=1 Tax=Kingdonia uniflora TaxID=39325 RepID=A0A7J7LHI1_9MAGN|nr:hypothetical protein GIB67_037011 [Kingdonia uniflora]
MEGWDPNTKSTLTKIPLLGTKAGPRDGSLWIARLKEEYKSLIAYTGMNKSNDNDWFRISSANPEGTKWAGKCWYVHNLLKYEFDLQFEIPVTYPSTAPELELPQLDGKTHKMYRGGKICLTVHFKPLWAKNWLSYIWGGYGGGASERLCCRASCHCLAASWLNNISAVPNVAPAIDATALEIDGSPVVGVEYVAVVNGVTYNDSSNVVQLCGLFALKASFLHPDGSITIHAESPTNPKCVNIELVSKLSQQEGIAWVDGTFATPMSQKVLTLGADIVLQFIGRLNDVLTGCFRGLWKLFLNPRFGIAHALCLGLAPWLAAEVPILVDSGMIKHKDDAASSSES